MTSEGTSGRTPEVNQENVPGSEGGDTPQAEGEPRDQVAPGADPQLPEAEKSPEDE